MNKGKCPLRLVIKIASDFLNAILESIIQKKIFLKSSKRSLFFTQFSILSPITDQVFGQRQF